MFAKRLIVVCMFLAIPGGLLTAQDGGTEGAGQPQALPPLRILKFSPLALLELPQPSFQVAYEYGVGGPLSVQHEAGWLLPFRGAPLIEEGAIFSGGKFKTEFRYYLDANPSHAFIPRRDYIAVEGLYRIRIVRDEGWQEMDGGTFSQWVVMDQVKQQMAFHFKYGRQVKLSGSGKVYADSWVGLGLRRYFVNYRYNSPEIIGEPDIARDPYSFVIPSLALGFRIGFGL